MDKLSIAYLTFVLAIIGGIVYMMATGQDDEGLLGLIMGLLFALVAGIMWFSVGK